MKALSISLVLAASLFATNSYAQDAQFASTIAGGVIGAAVGNHIGGTHGAVIGGLTGAYIGSEATRQNSRREVVYVREPKREVYYDNRPQTVVYQARPEPVYYAPPPVYYAPSTIYVERNYYGRGHHYGWHHHHH